MLPQFVKVNRDGGKDQLKHNSLVVDVALIVSFKRLVSDMGCTNKMDKWLSDG